MQRTCWTACPAAHQQHCGLRSHSNTQRPYSRRSHWNSRCHSHNRKSTGVRPFTGRRPLHVKAQASGPSESDKPAERDGGKLARDQEKLEKINTGQYLFYKVKEKAEQKVERTLAHARTRYLEDERKILYNQESDEFQNSKLIVSSPVMLLKHGVWSVIMLVFRLPITFFLRAAIAVGTWWGEKFSTKKFESFLMSEGEKIWGWKNRTENERWFWQYFFFRVLLPTVGGIFTYEAFVPNNFLWAVVVPYIFYWVTYGIFLSPWVFDWWLIMYLGLYVKCWPDVVGWLQWLTFIR